MLLKCLHVLKWYRINKKLETFNSKIQSGNLLSFQKYVCRNTNEEKSWLPLVYSCARTINIKLKLFSLDVNDPSVHRQCDLVLLTNVFEVDLDLILFFSPTLLSNCYCIGVSRLTHSSLWTSEGRTSFVFALWETPEIDMIRFCDTHRTFTGDYLEQRPALRDRFESKDIPIFSNLLILWSMFKLQLSSKFCGLDSIHNFTWKLFFTTSGLTDIS